MALRALLVAALFGHPAWAAIRAGAFETDITPDVPITVSGNFLPGTGKTLDGTLHARAIALDDGERRLIIATADSLMMPRELVDRVKFRAARSTGIPAGNMMISATHTHSAPPAMGALGTDEDPQYTMLLEQRLVEAIEGAIKRLAPAKAGWGVGKDYDHTHNRRWITRADKMLTDPFGNRSVRANMHPGYQNPNFVGPSGPVDPDLTVLSLQTADGKPIAMLANYSMHYVGAPGGTVSADYFGRFCKLLQQMAGGGIAIMSQGTSGDLMWMDYGGPKKPSDLDAYASELAGKAAAVLKSIQHRSDVTIDAKQTTLTLSRRLPDRERLAWAEDLLVNTNFRPPANQKEVYAREQMYLAATPTRELVLQALRIGDLGIAAIPNEVYALTGLKLKAQSPLKHTMNIELANGAEGYIPPPEQHKLGGYTTWPARTAGLEVQAEPKIVEALLTLLEQVSGTKRRTPVPPKDAYSDAVLAAKPLAYWRLEEMQGQQAADAAGNTPATFEDGIALYLEGASGRAVHLAGGRIQASIPDLPATYSVEFWLYNAATSESTIFQRGADKLTMKSEAQGFSPGLLTLSTHTNTWTHIAIVRNAATVTVYQNGERVLETQSPPDPTPNLTFGENFEGKLDEISVWNRALDAAEIKLRASKPNRQSR